MVVLDIVIRHHLNLILRQLPPLFTDYCMSTDCFNQSRWILQRLQDASERSTRFNLTTTSSRRRPSTNSQKRQRRKSPTSNPAPAREPRTVFYQYANLGRPHHYGQ